MPELPNRLELSVTLDGRPLGGAWVEVTLPMERKRDYVLLVGPTGPDGSLVLTRGELENQISVIQLSAFMDYSSLGVWRGELILRPFDVAAIERARHQFSAWPTKLLAAYPADFLDQMTVLSQRLAEHPGEILEVVGTAEGGSARVHCAPVHSPSRTRQ